MSDFALVAGVIAAVLVDHYTRKRARRRAAGGRGGLELVAQECATSPGEAPSATRLNA